MKKSVKTGYHRTAGICAWLLMLGLVSPLACPAAHADEDPFQLEDSQWKSFAHSNDDARRTDIVIPTLSQPANDEMSQASTPETQNAASPAAASAVAVAPPNRAIDLPVMPGLNKGFTVQVNSTEEEKPSLPVSSAKTTVDFPADKNWVAPTAPEADQASTDADGDALPLNVRMSYLPNNAIEPAGTPHPDTVQHKAHLALEKALAAKKTATANPAELAACAALDAYKKQQIDALQSDRRTLTALQDAIKSLGLDKHLSFMAGQGGDTLDTSGAHGVGGMDMPAKTEIR